MARKIKTERQTLYNGKFIDCDRQDCETCGIRAKCDPGRSLTREEETPEFSDADPGL